MKTLIIGAAGQLGAALCRELASWPLFTPAHEALDAGYPAALDAALEAWRPELIINTAAFHDVPRCEEEPQEAFRINTLATRALARSAATHGAKLIHISTDYVFDGAKGAPYREDDAAAPLNIYGETKLAGERQARLHCEQSWIVRTTGLFGRDPCRAKKGGKNFVELMRMLAATREQVEVVEDISCCPTSVDDLAHQLRLIAENQPAFGVYHAVNPEGLSWYRFAAMIFKAIGATTKLVPVSHRHFGDNTPRPLDSRLENAALQAAGLARMPSLEESLKRYLAA